MHATSVLVILGALLATTIAIPAPVVEQVEARAKIVSWEAAGGCSGSWAGRCQAQCVGEGVTKHGCNKDTVSSGIESSHCWFGFNVCECHCKTK